mgnify:CR=1 FL=1
MAAGPKKAKLAHEKRNDGVTQSRGTLFVPNKIVEKVEWPAGERGVIVELDGSGRLGIVSAWFAQTDKSTGELVPAEMSCPAVYDAIAGQKAVELYEAYTAAQASA